MLPGPENIVADLFCNLLNEVGKFDVPLWEATTVMGAEGYLDLKQEYHTRITTNVCNLSNKNIEI